MARDYKPSFPFDCPMMLLIPTTTMVKGVRQTVFPDPDSLSDEFLFFGSFRTFGGSENVSNGVYTIFNTGTIDTWYRADIGSDCRICVLETGAIYEIVNDPENIGMRHQFMQFKVQKVGGKP